MQHTTMAYKLADAPMNSAYVYDLRHDPAPFMAMSEDELAEACRWSPPNAAGPARLRLPVKTIKYNRCPAVAPAGVIKDAAVQERLKIDLQVVSANLAKLKADPDFAVRVLRACGVIDQERSALLGGEAWGEPETVDGQLYGGDFFSNNDKSAMKQVREAAPKDCAALQVSFQDKRLRALFPLFTARNHPQCLSDEQRKVWDAFCRGRLLNGGQNSRLAKFFKRIDELARDDNLTESQRFALEELHLYGESIMPTMDEADPDSPDD
jgi:exodeoxyribonuclease-1